LDRADPDSGPAVFGVPPGIGGDYQHGHPRRLDGYRGSVLEPHRMNDLCGRVPPDSEDFFALLKPRELNSISHTRPPTSFSSLALSELSSAMYSGKPCLSLLPVNALTRLPRQESGRRDHVLEEAPRALIYLAETP